VVSDETVEVTAEELSSPDAILASTMVMGNGVENAIQDIVFVRPENFSSMRTREIAEEVGAINRVLVEQHRPYLLIGFGRWGSSQPTLGIPVDWSQISGAKTIVETTLPEMNVELSQGSHFFHNLSSFRASYFMLRHDGPFSIDWDWLNRQAIVSDTELVRHVRLASPILVKVDGRMARGVVMRSGTTDSNKDKQ
ncbi:MAG: histidine kinase, partial [Candidatus Korobacteraceae bacterium]